MLDFRVEVNRGTHCILVSVSGELDIAAAPQVVQTLDALVDDPRRVVVDLLGTRFIDSTGVTTLFRASQRFEADGRAFGLVCGPGNTEVRRVIDLMGFDEVFTMFGSLAEADCDAPAGPTT